MEAFRVVGPAPRFPASVLMPVLAVVAVTAGWLHVDARGWAVGAAALLAGLGAWTFAEYALHRFILHGLDPFRRWHLEHHHAPDVPMRTPLLFSLPMVLVLAAAPSLLLGDPGLGLAFSGGLILGHLAQEVVHFHLHQPEPSREGWLRRRWRHHHFHHHVDERRAFGTLGGAWDRLLGTGQG